MGTGKKEASRLSRQGKTGDGMANVRVKGENFYRYVQLLRALLESFFLSQMDANQYM
jgi:nuclear GTP-binding protein